MKVYRVVCFFYSFLFFYFYFIFIFIFCFSMMSLQFPTAIDGIIIIGYEEDREGRTYNQFVNLPTR
jgi:hypothetical protein